MTDRRILAGLVVAAALGGLWLGARSSPAGWHRLLGRVAALERDRDQFERGANEAFAHCRARLDALESSRATLGDTVGNLVEGAERNVRRLDALDSKMRRLESSDELRDRIAACEVGLERHSAQHEGGGAAPVSTEHQQEDMTRSFHDLQDRVSELERSRATGALASRGMTHDVVIDQEGQRWAVFHPVAESHDGGSA